MGGQGGRPTLTLTLALALTLPQTLSFVRLQAGTSAPFRFAVNRLGVLTSLLSYLPPN